MDDGENPGVEIGAMDCVQIPPGYPQRVQNTGSDDLIFLAVCSKRFQNDVYQPHEEPDMINPDYSADFDSHKLTS